MTQLAEPVCYRFNSTRRTSAVYRDAKSIDAPASWLEEYNAGIIRQQRCPFCSGRTELIFKPHLEVDYNIFGAGTRENNYSVMKRICFCTSCGWYRFSSAAGFIEDDQISVEDHTAVMTRQNPFDASVPLVELEQYLQKHWDERKLLTAGKAQDIVAGIFKEHLEGDVRYFTSGVFSKDGGIDFVIVTQGDNLTYAFQVKRRLTDSPERIEEVREFLGSMAVKGFDRGFFVTTAPRFARGVRAEIANGSANLRRKRMKVSLVDGTEVFALLQKRQLPPQHLVDRLYDIGVVHGLRQWRHIARNGGQVRFGRRTRKLDTWIEALLSRKLGTS